MKYIIVLSKKYYKPLIILSLAAAIIITSAVLFDISPVFSISNGNQEIEATLNDYFNERCTSLITGDVSYIDGQFDKSSKYGRWSYEHEVMRIKYLNEWAAARGVTLEECESNLKIFSIKKPSADKVKIYLSDRTRVAYSYKNQQPKVINEFGLGTRHSITLVNKGGIWFVTVDWYNDPLEDSMPSTAPSATLESEEYQQTSSSSWFTYDRKKAVEYADKYCGANFNIEDGYKYNKKYRSFADLGGDCANFASQVLSDKEAGGIKMGGGWLYKNGEASAAWVNAGAFTKNLLYSGRAKQITRGKYKKAVNFSKYMSPGDIVSYERKGDIVHVSIVTAIDSMGVPLVNSHTNDRYHVPWDLGWNGDNITFWFLKING